MDKSTEKLTFSATAFKPLTIAADTYSAVDFDAVRAEAVLAINMSATVEAMAAIVEARAERLEKMVLLWAKLPDPSEIDATDLAGVLLPMAEELKQLASALQERALSPN